jgi:hypothetical protein
MNHRIELKKTLIGMILLFIIGIIFTDSVKSQAPPVSAIPLSTVSIFDLPKDPGSNLSSQNTLQAINNTDDNGIPVPFPKADITFEKVCEPTTITLDQELACTITLQNNSAENYSYKILDLTSPNLTIQEDSVIGAEYYNYNILMHRGVIAGGTPASLAVTQTNSSLVYNSLSALGIPPLSNVADETIINLSTLNPFIFNGESYNVVGMTSNGYLIAGLGSDEDITYTPQQFPDPAFPNNVIAPFWTDLNPEDGGNLYAALLTRDGESWVVLEWENVPAFADDKPAPNCGETCTNQFTFQVWIKTNTDVQDITFIYATIDGPGASSGLNIGAENIDGTIGANYESLPVAEDKLMVASTPGTEGESHIISYTAEPIHSGNWIGCALVKVLEVRGINFDCTFGTITE